jgi:hypothetical protein
MDTFNSKRYQECKRQITKIGQEIMRDKKKRDKEVKRHRFVKTASQHRGCTAHAPFSSAPVCPMYRLPANPN